MPDEPVIVISEDDVESQGRGPVRITGSDVARQSAARPRKARQRNAAPVVVTASDVEQHSQSTDGVVRLEPGYLVEGAAIRITPKDVTEGDIRALFEPELMRLFIAYVSSGLPAQFLKANKDLSNVSKQRRIKSTLRKVPDRDLRKHLLSRLDALEHPDRP